MKRVNYTSIGAVSGLDEAAMRLYTSPLMKVRPRAVTLLRNYLILAKVANYLGCLDRSVSKIGRCYGAPL
jgi:hypothetical protein